MFITKSIKKFIFFNEDSILECLKKIEKNKYGTIFITDISGSIQGVVTDGDLRRWLSKSIKPNLDSPISKVMNIDYVTCNVIDSRELIASKFSERVKIIPILDLKGRIESIALQESKAVELGDHIITNNIFEQISYL